MRIEIRYLCIVPDDLFFYAYLNTFSLVPDLATPQNVKLFNLNLAHKTIVFDQINVIINMVQFEF